MDLVDDDVVELGRREFLPMALKHLNGSEKEIRVQSFLIAPIEHGIASRGFEDGLEGFPGSLQNRVFVGQEKQPFEELEARKSYELVLITHNGSASKFRIITEWTDSSGKQHTKTQMGDFS